ncbi:hypothetical protein AN6759.2 [Aspergillus nidulans FGSC A4]|nr:hypothetical protein AN6759.2 [Aspergillus nidulans FGSC A4]|eukprot:XP_664363.1 hypothetical protein AN6759.2 [Aspergillus nidulans FGSC A4]
MHSPRAETTSSAKTKEAVGAHCQAQDYTGGWLDQGVLEELNMDFVQTLDPNTASSSSSEMIFETPASAESSWITDLGLSLAVLEHLLDGFRSLARYFPFVIIPADWTVTYMAEDRPFLLLSAVACVASRFSNLQQALAEELKGTLSHRVVIAGEKGLDLLQGLLVHLAWFHFYLDPRSRQTYQYLQLAISMVVELDLEQKIADLIEGSTAPGDLCSREACRAYLGCYYLSSLIATATSKPDNFHYSELLLRCTRMLQHEQESPTDELIYPLIKLQQLARETFDAQARPRSMLTSGYHAVKIRIFDMGLVYKYGQRKRPPKSLSGDSMTSASFKVVLNLTKCLIGAKELFDVFMVIPEGEHDKLPLSIWYQLILAIMVLYRLSVGLPETSDWDREIAHDAVNLPESLDKLIDRLRSAESKRRAESQPSNDKCLFTIFPDMLRQQQFRALYSKTSMSCNAQSTEAGR